MTVLVFSTFIALSACSPFGQTDCFAFGKPAVTPVVTPVVTWLYARHVTFMLRQWRIESGGKMI